MKLSLDNKIYTLLFDDPQIGKLDFFYTKGTNCIIQYQSISHVEIINNFFINRGNTS